MEGLLAEMKAEERLLRVGANLLAMIVKLEARVKGLEARVTKLEAGGVNPLTAGEVLEEGVESGPSAERRMLELAFPHSHSIADDPTDAGERR